MRQREPFYDNIKFILIALVVCSHFGFEQRTFLPMHGFVNVLGSFIVPVYVLISGYFAKNIVQQRKEDVMTLLVPYIILEILHLAFTKTTGMGEGNKFFGVPTYQNWYILALFFWRLIIPYFRFLKPSVGIPIAFVIGFGAGTISQFTDFLTLHRMLFYLPVFVIGYYLKDLKAITHQSKFVSILAVLTFIALECGIYYYTNQSAENAQKLLYSFAPMFGYYGDIANVQLRILTFGITALLTVCFLFLVPKKETFFTKYGKQSLYVYLFHMFLVWPIIKFISPYQAVFSEVIAIVLSLLIAIVLSTKLAEKILNPFINPFQFFKNLNQKAK